MSRFLIAVLAVSIPLASARAAAPLFAEMAGTWSGTGTRTFTASGKTAEISTCVEAAIETDGGAEYLVSRNHWEIGGVEPFEKTYWIREAGGGRYEMGQGREPAREFTTAGEYEAHVFRTVQKLSADGSWAVLTETRFGEDRAEYREHFIVQGKEYSTARIEYLRREGDCP